MHNFAAGVLPAGTGSNLVSGVTTAIANNIVEILVVLGFVVGLSIVMALLDTAKEGRMLADRDRYWRNAARRHR